MPQEGSSTCYQSKKDLAFENKSLLNFLNFFRIHPLIFYQLPKLNNYRQTAVDSACRLKVERESKRPYR